MLGEQFTRHAMTDFIFMVDQTSHMFITGPEVIKTVTGEEVSFDELGGSETHSSKSGVSDLRLPSEADAMEAIRAWLSYVPSNNLEQAPRHNISEDAVLKISKKQGSLTDIVPSNPNQPYDMKEVIRTVVDPDSFFEMKASFAPNICTGFARLDGQSVGIIGNNPLNLAGVLDIEASVKAARFVRFCDCFNIPIITFRRCTWISTWHRSRERRHNQTWSETSLRI